MTRVYVASSLVGLARTQAAGHVEPADTTSTSLMAYAVTPAVREWYVEGDLDELEYSAMIDAAEASLVVLAADPAAPRRRVVIAADVPEGSVKPLNGPMDDADTARSAVTLTGTVPLSAIVSIHVDETEAEKTVIDAVHALEAARQGDDDARFLLDEAEALDLLWYDVSEIDELVSERKE